MKIAICICFSKKNEIYHHKIINNLNIIKIPKECNLSFYLVVNNNPTKLIDLSEQSGFKLPVISLEETLSSMLDS